jgi:hypothetical protein
VLLHGREAHRVGVRQPRHRQLALDRATQDVAARGVRQRMQQAVDFGLRAVSYNHLVVSYRIALGSAAVPAWITKLLPLMMRTPWTRVFAVGTWLLTTGKKRLDQNLVQKERGELVKLMTKSKGKPSNLTDQEKTRLRRLVYKAATGHFPS